MILPNVRSIMYQQMRDLRDRQIRQIIRKIMFELVLIMIMVSLNIGVGLMNVKTLYS